MYKGACITETVKCKYNKLQKTKRLREGGYITSRVLAAKTCKKDACNFFALSACQLNTFPLNLTLGRYTDIWSTEYNRVQNRTTITDISHEDVGTLLRAHLERNSPVFTGAKNVSIRRCR
jgi:hypothetical protein